MQTTAVKIEKVDFTRIIDLQKICVETFIETFSEQNTAKDMNTYINKNLSVEQLYYELHHPKSVFYFAVYNDRIVGYLKINSEEAQTELQTENGLEIERIYTLKEFQGQKIGQLLFETAVQFAQSIRAAYIWLGVWEKNTKAIDFYKKNGFAAFDQHIFRLGADEQTDIMMKLNLYR